MDCIEGMRNIPDDTIDCIVTDPPYPLTEGGAVGNWGNMVNCVSRDRQRKNEMFEIPPFKDWMEQAFRVLKDGTHFYCMTNDRNMQDMLNTATDVGFRLVNILVWDKKMGMPLPYYQKNIEFVILFRKGKAREINDKGSTALLKCRGVFGTKVHPSEKPTELFRHLIENSTDKGDLVLDPFMGSFTTAIACQKSKRHYIGFEKSEEYYEIGKKRYDAETRQLSLF